MSKKSKRLVHFITMYILILLKRQL